MTDIFDFMSDLSNLSNEDLHALSGMLQKEIEIRKQHRKEQAIANFKQAFSELKDAGINLYVSDYEMSISCYDWDLFEFD